MFVDFALHRSETRPKSNTSGASYAPPPSPSLPPSYRLLPSFRPSWVKGALLFRGGGAKESGFVGRRVFPRWHYQIPVAKLATLLNIPCQQLLWAQFSPLVF